MTEGASIAVLGFEAADPIGYGGCFSTKSGRLEAIREEKDASDAERALTGSAIPASWLSGPGCSCRCWKRIGNDNAKGEYYLTDAVGWLAATA